MRSGGGGQYDMVSASGDASLRLIYGERRAAGRRSNWSRSWKNFFPPFKSPPHNTVDGKHYGISLQSGPNTLLYNTQGVSRRRRAGRRSTARSTRARSPSRTTRSRSPTRRSTCSKTQPSLGIKDPYELNKTQFDAASSLLKKQRPLIKKYWALASDEIELFKNGDVVDRRRLAVPDDHCSGGARRRSRTSIPKEGATGWLDTWMLSAKAKHPNCAYKWYATTSRRRRCRRSRRIDLRRDAGQPRPART